MNFRKFIETSYLKKAQNNKLDSIQESKIDYSEKYEYSMLKKTTLKEYNNSRCL